MSKINAVVFDIDGTLINSCEFIYTAMEFALAKHDVPGVTREAMSSVIGKPIHAMYEILAPHKDSALLEADHRAHHADNEHLLCGYDGAAETLGKLKSVDLKIGAFTGSDRSTSKRLTDFGLLQFFDSIVENSRYTRHKPDPEGLLLCLRELQVEPAQAIYVGDGVIDMTAGKAAGVAKTIGITHGFTPGRRLKQAGADYVVDSLPDVLKIVSRLNTTASKKKSDPLTASDMLH